MRNTLRLLVLALVIGPAFSPADKKTDDSLTQINRDVAALDEDVKALQKSQKTQEDKLDAMRQLVQQSMAASNQVTQEMAALKRDLASLLTTSLAASATDQQSKISLAVGPLGSQMDTLTQNMGALTQTVGQMNTRMVSLDTRLKDLSDKVSLLNQPAPLPPPPAAGVAPTPVPDPNTPPPGVTRLSLWTDAEKDFASAYDDRAISEYADFIKYFKDDEYAPTAGYRIGMVYARQKEYDEAVQAFQKVIDTWPGNNKAQDALYQKAKTLAAAGHKTEAIATYKEFLHAYGANDYATQAQAELSKLQAPPPPRNNGKGKGGAK